ncbi:MAG: MFS transporter [Chloroflexota bacterium]
MLFTDLGLAVAQVGLLSGLLMLGAAVGGVAAGILADRIGGRNVVVLSMLLACSHISVRQDRGPWRLVFLAAAGFFVGMPHSILVLAGQNLLPGRRATASGIILGFMFFAGSVGTIIIGISADQIGLASALQAIAVLPLIAALIAFVALETVTQHALDY